MNISRSLAFLSAGVLSLALSTFGLTQPSQAGSVLNDVITRGVLRIATVPSNPPYSSVNASGEPEGYDVEIGKRIAAALKVKPEFTMVDTAGRITALQTGRVDITVADFTNTVERSTAIAFTDPYAVIGSVFMVAKDAPIKSVEELNDAKYKIGVARGGTTEATAQRVAPNAQLVRFDTVLDAYMALQAGQVDAHLQDSLKNASFLKKANGAMRNLDGNFSYEEIGIGLPAGDFDWWRVVNTWVRQFNNSGENARLFETYFGYQMPKFN